METSQIAEYFYNGVWRLDLGLGNPNKTAALLVQCALLSIALIKFGKWGKWVSVICFLGSVICIFHTFSRGGICALLVGLTIFGAFTYYKFSWKEWRFKFIIIISLFTYCIVLGAQKRYVHGFFSEDRSITNRLSIWRKVPEMIADSPWGWGVGEAGNAFMKWYQPTESSEQYRTLVNSHFTWLVEINWIGRFAYILLWILAVGVCLPFGSSRINPIPLAVIVSFAVSSFFSSVAESFVLWIIPCICLGRMILFRITNKFPLNKFFILGTSSTCFFLIIFIAILNSDSYVKKEKNYVKIGCEETGVPRIWIISDSLIFGNKLYMSSLKDIFKDDFIKKYVSIGICESVSNIPENHRCQCLLLSGNSLLKEEQKINKINPETIIVFSPQFNPLEIPLCHSHNNKLKIFIGEFSESEYLSLWQELPNCYRLEGVGDYIPDLGNFLINIIHWKKSDILP